MNSPERNEMNNPQRSTNSPDIGDCLREGWALYQREPLLLSGATILMGVIYGVGSLIPLAGALLYAPLLAGLYSLVIRIDRGQPVTLANLFDGFSCFLPLVIASVIISVLVTIGLIALVLPGLYLITVYGFTTLFIFDQKQDFWPAMENSRKTIHAHFWNYGLLGLLLLAICIVASIPFGLGLIIAAPVCIAAQYRFYRAVVTSDEVV